MTNVSSQPVTFDSGTMIEVTPAAGDSTAMIRAAAQAALQDGKTLFFAPGTYTVSSTIAISAHENWAAAAGSVTLEAAPSLATMITINGVPGSAGPNPVPVSDVSLTGIAFQGSSTAIPAHAPLIVSWISSGLTLQDDTVQNVSGIGILMSNTQNSHIAGCSFINVGNAPEITGNLTDASQGIAFTGDNILHSSGNSVVGCTFGAIGLDAISATQQDNFSASGNSMLGLNQLNGWNNSPTGAAGIYLNSDSNVTVSANRIEGASGSGIDALDVTGLSAINNSVSRSNGSGIVVFGVHSADISSNICNDNNVLLGHFLYDSGITVSGDGQDPSSNVIVESNTCGSTSSNPSQDWGLQVPSGAVVSGLTVLDTNQFLGNALGEMSSSSITPTTPLLGPSIVAIGPKEYAVLASIYPASAATIQSDQSDPAFLPSASGAPSSVGISPSAIPMLMLSGAHEAVNVTQNELVVGGPGNDTITSTARSVTVRGSSGSILFMGNAGAGTVTGGSGSTTLFGGSDGGLLQGGTAGHNALLASGGNTTLLGAGAGDTLVGAAGTATLVLHSGDTAFGGSGASAIFSGGYDLMLGGAGTTTIMGGASGHDVMWGCSGNTVEFGSGPGDTLASGSGRTVMVGDSGDTLFVCLGGSATAYGGGGNDTFFLAGGTTSIVQAPGNDLVVFDGQGSNSVIGGAGTDIYDVIGGVGKSGGTDVISGFKVGTDQLRISDYGSTTLAESVVGGSTVLTLGDSTQITLVGIAHLSLDSVVWS